MNKDKKPLAHILGVRPELREPLTIAISMEMVQTGQRINMKDFASDLLIFALKKKYPESLKGIL